MFQRLIQGGRATLLVAALLAGCSETTDPPADDPVIAQATISGDDQTGVVSRALAQPIRVIVTQDGEPLAGSTVTWAADGAGASVSPTTSTTDAQGIAFTTWTLGSAVGAQTARATLTGATGSPIQFSATATAAGPVQAVGRK